MNRLTRTAIVVAVVWWIMENREKIMNFQEIIDNARRVLSGLSVPEVPVPNGTQELLEASLTEHPDLTRQELDRQVSEMKKGIIIA